MIPTEAVPLAIGRDGIGVGKIPEAGRALDVQGDTYFDGTRIRLPLLENLVGSSGTLNCMDAEWRNVEGVGFYYFGNGSIGRGYPANYGYVLHISRPGSAVILQVYIASAGRLWTRMINANEIHNFSAV